MRRFRLFFLVMPAFWSAHGQNYTMSTIAGGGFPLNVPATSTSFGIPTALVADAAGNVFFSARNMILRVDAGSGTLTLVAGTGNAGYAGDGGPAASAQLFYPQGLALDSAGSLYIATR